MAFLVTKNEAFRKRSLEWIFLTTPFSCCHVDRCKQSFWKTLTSQHRFTTYQSMRSGFRGSHKGILIVCFLLSKFEQRSLNVAASSCGRGYFRKRSSCRHGYIFIRIKKMRFQKYPDTCGRGLSQCDKWLLIYGTGKAEYMDASKTVFRLYIEFSAFLRLSNVDYLSDQCITRSKSQNYGWLLG